MINIYVGNMPYDTTESELREHFGQYGEVGKVTLIVDRETGRPKGYGFVQMLEPEAGREAIEKLSGEPFNGRPLTINEARNRREIEPVKTETEGGYSRVASAGDAEAVADDAPVSQGYSNRILPGSRLPD
ncbi:MAG: RNA-binding protein [Planctomycetota bacterium]